MAAGGCSAVALHPCTRMEQAANLRMFLHGLLWGDLPEIGGCALWVACVHAQAELAVKTGTCRCTLSRGSFSWSWAELDNESVGKI